MERSDKKADVGAGNAEIEFVSRRTFSRYIRLLNIIVDIRNSNFYFLFRDKDSAEEADNKLCN